MPNAPLPTWPDWETVRKIGQGSSGTVYEIQKDILVGVEKAALKVISIPQSSSDIDEMYGDGHDSRSITTTFQSYLKSVVSEYAMMRKLNGCPQIVNCDDVRYIQHSDGIGWDIFIKMELLNPLTKALPLNIPQQTVVQIAWDMCLALEQCQKFGILHRDIKPQNIFATDDGKYKLGDFGIAKTVEKTKGGTKIGTYKYMAPEIYNNQPYGITADIYSLGLVLYWMLNERRLPFVPLPPARPTTEVEEQARERRFSGQPIPAPKNGSDPLKRIVLKACAFNPNDRYQSASQMLDDLMQLQGSTPATISTQAPPLDIPQDDEGDMTMRVFDKPIPTDEPSGWQHGGNLPNDGFSPAPFPPQEKKKKRQKKSPLLWIILAVILIAGIAAAVIILNPWGDKSSEELEMKDYVGSSLEYAYQSLDSMGMVVTITKQEDKHSEAGTILSQSPAAGTPLKKGDAVSLVVSIGTSAGKRITVTFDPNGGTVKTASAILIYGQPYGDLPYPTRKGYSFDGWFTKPEGGNRIWKATEILAQNTDHTIYAQWTLNNYTITLDSCGGTLDTSTVQRNYGEAYGELPKPTLPGKEFLGWFTAPTGGERVWKGTVLVTDSDHTLYAQWNTNAYTVTLDPNGGKVSKDSVSLEYGAVYGELPKPTRKGHTFVGWFTKATGGKQVWQSTALYIQADHTLYAQWTVNTYTVTLNATGGTLDTKSVDIVYGTSYGELPRPTREGYTFEGWYTKSSGGERIWKGTTLTTDQDHTLYARWKKK